LNNRLSILDIWVDPVGWEEAIDRVRGFLRNGDRPHCIFASNPEKHFSVPRDPELYDCYRQADLLLPGRDRHGEGRRAIVWRSLAVCRALNSSSRSAR